MIFFSSRKKSDNVHQNGQNKLNQLDKRELTNRNMDHEKINTFICEFGCMVEQYD